MGGLPISKCSTGAVDPGFPLSWSDVKRTAGIYASCREEGKRFVSVGSDLVVVVTRASDSLEAWVDSVRMEHSYRLLQNAKLCLEIRE